MNRFSHWLVTLATLMSVTSAAADVKSSPRVRVTTNVGVIELELYADKAPLTVKNFLDYVDAGFYENTIFHRVIKGFMIQGGGLTGRRPGGVSNFTERSAHAPIKNEADNGLKNFAGTIAMARTADPHSASSQFFINTADNAFLDHRDQTPAGWGYCVFGKVVKGMDVVKRIESTSTSTVGRFENVPTKDILIQKAERITAK